MEGLLGELKEWSPLVTMLGVGITIFLLGWRFPNKAVVNKGDDNLQRQINQRIDLTLAVNKEIREDTRQMRSEIAELTRNLHTETAKLTDNFHTEIAKLSDKIEANTLTILERIDESAREIRLEIRELNKEYKAHLLQHAEKK